jgi:hypothetical protein
MEKIMGQLSKISSTADQSIRLQIDVPYEQAQDVMSWLYQMVKIELVEVTNDNR